MKSWLGTFIAIYVLVELIQLSSAFIEPIEIEILEGIDYSFSIEYCNISIAHHQSFQTVVSALCYCTYDPSTEISSNCGAPGPTFIFYSGTTISMTWYNNLVTIGETVSSEEFHDQPKDLDITNIHLHGMHISPDEDNVLLEILPGEYHQYIYHIPADHYPGTLWLHAHHHGSASFQIHSGLFSALLSRYQDRSDLIDDSLINMKENVLVFHFINVATTDLCHNCNNETLWKSLYYFPPQYNEQDCVDGKECFVTFTYCYEYCSIPVQQRAVSGFKYDITTNYTESEFLLFLVNGQFEPVIDDLTVNTFRRLRFINTYNQFYLQYLFPLVGCEWYLIAIDGIFLNNNEVRSLNEDPYLGQYILPPGGRIDVIVKCAEIGTYSIYATESDERSQTELETLTRAPEGTLLFSIKVNTDGTGTDTVTEIPEQYPPKPDYLTDLRDETTESIKQCACNTYVPSGNTRLTPWGDDECGLVFNMAKTHNINGFQFDLTTPMTSLDFNSVYEFRLITHMHPLHHHVNPFQIQSDVGNGFIAQSGDFFDTFGVGKGVEATMRMVTADFYGIQVVHCHILPHEDRGQMTWYEILQPNQFCDAGDIVTEPTVSTTKQPTMIFEPIIPTPNPTVSYQPLLYQQIPTPNPTSVIVETIDQVTIETCFIEEAIPSPCACEGSVCYDYTAIVSEKCDHQILTTGSYGTDTCNPSNTVYKVGEMYTCKVLSCETGEFAVVPPSPSPSSPPSHDSANRMGFVSVVWILMLCFIFI